MEKLYKSFAAKADADAGEISGYFSTYDRIPDSYGDVIAPGAFTNTIKTREESGHPFPLCWNHDLDQIIGKVESIEDTEKGPLVTASFFNTALAQEKRELVKSGVVYQFSFAYSIEDAAEVELEDGTKANELRKLDLYEVSVVPVPANPRAEVTDVKADTRSNKAAIEVRPSEEMVKAIEAVVKSGRRNSKADAGKLEQAVKLIQEVLGQLEDTPEGEDSEEDSAKANVTTEEPARSNSRKDALIAFINARNGKEV